MVSTYSHYYWHVFFHMLAMYINPSLMELPPSKIEIMASTYSAPWWPPSAAFLTIFSAVESLRLKKSNYKRNNTLRLQNKLMQGENELKTVKLPCLLCIRLLSSPMICKYS